MAVRRALLAFVAIASEIFRDDFHARIARFAAERVAPENAYFRLINSLKMAVASPADKADVNRAANTRLSRVNR